MTNHLISETVLAIRTVKLSNWDLEMEKRINHLRDNELHYLRGRKYLDAICVYLWASAPVIITIAIFMTYSFILQEKLTAAKIFTSLALVNILIMPLNAFPWVLNGVVEAYVSVRRLDKIFSIDNIDFQSIFSLSADPRLPLSLKNACFWWKEGIAVNNVTFAAEMGKIIGIIGPVGSGKSTFLLGLLGETEMCSDYFRVSRSVVSKGFGFVSQDSWLKSGTVRENIVCGAPFDSVLYEEVIHLTALKQDIQALPGSDSYEVGDGGNKVSGGQRTRIALARALYQDRDIYLLDDPFASLDTKVGQWIWDKAIVHFLKARGKTVIIASHHTSFISQADVVLTLDTYGHIIKQESPAGVISMPDIPSHDSCDSFIDMTEIDLGRSQRLAVETENKEVGTVRIGVYGAYIRAAGVFLVIAIVIALFAMQMSKNVSDWWLTKWTEKFNENLSVSFILNEPDNDRDDRGWLFGRSHSRSPLPVHLYLLGIQKSCVLLANLLF
ncbi:hypothetical protein AB6A40_009013 [Gnathostoma spinigerum]|uniref:Uncharacterized protein n=1 Tax=Gnathostoma spinigerum TaxID=75299 RepID=A0ABD6EQQ2_9BILA